MGDEWKINMRLMIDGHNLIPKIPGMQLSNPDDEMELVRLLQIYCRIKRQTVSVFFDGAPASQAKSRRFGQVTAHFIHQGSTADDAIIEHLTRLGKRAREVMVVTSDRRVQNEARARHSPVMTSEKFAFTLMEAVQHDNQQSQDPEMSDDELNEWLRLFSDTDSPDN